MHCAIVGFPTKQEFREKSWHIVNIIANLKDKLIRLESRFINAPNNMVGRPYLTGDCSDFKINEPFPWNKKWCSPKFKGPGMKYEVCLAIYSPNICWSNGPHYASASEGTIFTTGLGTKLPEDEPVEVDAGVKGDPRLMRPLMGVNSLARKQKSVYRARQESIFSRMKQFNVLDTHFHHTCTEEEDYMKKHQICFDSVLVITQLKLMMKVDKLMDVGEIDEVEYVMT